MAVSDESELIRQNETQCRILGVDTEGWTHVYDKHRDRVVVISRHGINEQVPLAELDQDLGDWMQFVAARRGWYREQWDGYRLASVVFGGES